MKEPISLGNVWVYEDRIHWIDYYGLPRTELRGGENEALLLKMAIRQIEDERENTDM